MLRCPGNYGSSLKIFTQQNLTSGTSINKPSIWLYETIMVAAEHSVGYRVGL